MSVRRRFLGTRGDYAVDFLRSHQDEPIPSDHYGATTPARDFWTR